MKIQIEQGDDLYFILRDGDIKISDSSLTSDKSKTLGIRIAKTIGVECAYNEDLERVA